MAPIYTIIYFILPTTSFFHYHWPGVSEGKGHSIAEPEPSILGKEIAPDSACVKALPLALALLLHLC